MNKDSIELTDQLLKIYPNKIYPSISDIEKYPVYDTLTSYCEKHNMEKSEILDSLKFDKENKYDIKTINEIIEKYDFIQEDFADFFGISRQRVSKIVNKKMNHNYMWKDKYFSTNEKNVIRKMVEKKKWESEYGIDFFKCRIVTNFKKVKNKNQTKLLLLTFIKNDDKIFINQLDSIVSPNLLKKHGYYAFSEISHKKMREISLSIENNLEVDNTINSSIKDEINHLLKESTLENRIEFLDFIGLDSSFDYKDKRLADEDRFEEILDEHANDNNEVKISSHSPTYAYLANNASRNNMGISEFIESFGFIYINKRDTTAQQNQLKQKLKARNFVDNFVYIDPLDPLYNTLSSTAYKNGVSLSEFIEEKYGYKRLLLKDIDEETIKLYNWTDELKSLEEETVRENVISFLDEDNILRIDSSSELYKQLSIYSKMIDKSPTEVLKLWGIEYSFEKVKVTDNEKIEDILKELEHLTSQIKKTTVRSEKLSRNKTLVKKLKSLYNYKCQICSQNDEIAPIETTSGRNYIEVHHIQSLNKFNDKKSINDESNLLIDHYKNCLVVCPHHHKFIHFHHGGFKDLDDDKVCLINDNGEKLKISTDYHIR